MKYWKTAGNFGVYVSAGRLKLFCRTLLALVACCALSTTYCLLPTAVNAADWPTFRGNNARTGFVSEQAYPPLAPAWDFQMAEDMISSPIIFDGMLYIGSRVGTVYARNARTGAPVWQYQTGDGIGASPAVSGDMVYIPSMDGYLYAINRLSGSLVWKAGLGSSSISSPLVSGGKVFVGAGLPGKKLEIFDAATGDRLFEYPANQPVDGAPAAYGNAVYFGANDGRIYGLNRDSYSTLWHDPDYYRETIGSFGINAVAVSSGALYVLPGRDEKQVFMLDALTGVQLKVSAPIEASNSWEQVASPVVTKDRVYFAAGASGVSLYALDSQTLLPPAPAWPDAPSLGAVMGFGILSSPAMANEIIYAATTDGRLVAVNSSGVSVAADIDISSPAYSSPAVANGMVFIANSGGKLIAYTAAKAAAFSAPAPDALVSGLVAVKGYVVNPHLTGYTLEYGAGAEPSGWTPVQPSSATVYSVEGGTLAYWNTDTVALPNGLYTLKLTVFENPASGTDNTALLTVRVNTAPLPPSGLVAADVPGDFGNKLGLDWSASPSSGLTAYRIYRDAGRGPVQIASVGAGSLDYTDTAAATGSTYTYTVRAFDGWLESGNSNQVSAYSINDSGDTVSPAATTDLSAVPGQAPGIVLLVWTAPGNDGDIGTASHYIIKHTTVPDYDWNNFDDGPGLFSGTRAVEGPAGAREAEEVRGLKGGTTYYFALKTADFVPNYSGLSNIVNAYAARDMVPPLPPSGLTATDTPGDDGRSLTLTWSLSPDDGSGADDVYGYRLYRRGQNSAYVSSSPYAAISAGVNSYVDNAATENNRFYYVLSAFDSTSDSPLSNEAVGVPSDNWRFFDASQGGSIRLPDGARVDIPENAASQNDNIMMSKLDPVTFQPLFKVNANTQVRATGIVYEIKFRNAATALVKPAVITLPYTDAAVAGMNLENLRLYTLSAGVWTMVNTSKPDPAAKKVSAEVSHFSVYSIMEYVPSGELLDKSEVYTYPNPAKGAALTFKFKPADKAFVRIDVYNIAGEKVARLEKQDCPAGLTSEIVWGIENIASGVYQYKVEAVSASGTKSVIKRLAVIH